MKWFLVAVVAAVAGAGGCASRQVQQEGPPAWVARANDKAWSEGGNVYAVGQGTSRSLSLAQSKAQLAGRTKIAAYVAAADLSKGVVLRGSQGIENFVEHQGAVYIFYTLMKMPQE